MFQFKEKISIKIMGIIILLLLIITAIRIVTKDGNNKTNTETEDYKPMIGISADSLVIERWQRDVEILKNKGEEAGYNVEVVNAYEDADKQKQQIKSLIEQKAKVIFIIAYDKDSLSEVIEEARRKNIIIISYDRLIRNANVDAYVSFDNVAVGEYMAKALVEKVPKGNYVIINGSSKDNNSTMFNEGYYNILQEYIDKEDIKIVKEVWAEDWREEFAYDAVSELLEEGIKIDGIIGANDRLAESSISVLSEYGLVGKVPVVGHDADISACQNIIEGKQLMTVYKPIKNLAEGAFKVAMSLLAKQDQKSEETIFDGTYDVPYFKFDAIPVDASNMKETVIADLFHKEEDIYR
ncbi:sugar ABC transporter substrate-binding protein [Clostridium grantii]|uniref:D-xylose transport system substrate-binding protein n=1 Tax=Clostridium grantii DSM 8605 TaxID=1121316 RepID=A0A1M5X7D0_9CLOT|nr:substrate-binding domain-containing protein [Clostridium grantii]SHH95478.1 D-xylose transport system substrate-binding protein [Clostridium grantii DSM 8605]